MRNEDDIQHLRIWLPDYDKQLAVHAVFAKFPNMNNAHLLALFKEDMSLIPTAFSHFTRHKIEKSDLFAECLDVFDQHWRFQTTVQSLHYMWYAIVMKIPLDYTYTTWVLSGTTWNKVVDICATLEYPLNVLASLYRAITARKSLHIADGQGDEFKATLKSLNLSPVTGIYIEAMDGVCEEKIKLLEDIFKNHGYSVFDDSNHFHTHHLI